MPIQSISQTMRAPILGTIRLGVRKQTAKGVEYPSNKEHFVLTDAPDVARVYGNEPRELDVLFPDDDLSVVAPTWLKAYSASIKDQRGNVRFGELQCRGDGPDQAGNPGTAFWYAKRDPITRVVPTRPCLGEQCPDWKGCKPTMTLLVILPRVSLYGVYQIHTSSWRAIRQMTEQLQFAYQMRGGKIAFVPFKLTREEEQFRFTDPKTKQEKNTTHHILHLRPNEHFMETYGDEVKQVMGRMQGAHYLLPSEEEIVTQPMDEHWPVKDGGEPVNCTPALPAEDSEAKFLAIVRDPAVASHFDLYDTLLGKVSTEKGRLIAVKKKIGAPDVKAAVLETLEGLIAREKERVGQQVPPPPANEPPAGVVVDADGIM